MLALSTTTSDEIRIQRTRPDHIASPRRALGLYRLFRSSRVCRTQPSGRSCLTKHSRVLGAVESGRHSATGRPSPTVCPSSPLPSGAVHVPIRVLDGIRMPSRDSLVNEAVVLTLDIVDMDSIRMVGLRIRRLGGMVVIRPK